MSLIDFLKRLLGIARSRSPFPPGCGPARLLVMRHAEKTADKFDPNLSEAGYARAANLATYIPQTFGEPDFLFAARDSKKSIRPRLTIEPLARALGIAIDGRFDDEEPQAIINELASGAYVGKCALISWRHSDLAGFLRMLGAPEGTFPDPWPSACYDLIVEIAYSNGAPPTARQIKPPF